MSIEKFIHTIGCDRKREMIVATRVDGQQGFMWYDEGQLAMEIGYGQTNADTECRGAW